MKWGLAFLFLIFWAICLLLILSGCEKVSEPDYLTMAMTGIEYPNSPHESLIVRNEK